MAILTNRVGLWINVLRTGWIFIPIKWINSAAVAYNDERVFYARKKFDQIKAAGATMIVVPCHSCHGQFNNVKGEYGFEDLEVKYLWELVADCLII